MEHVATGRTGMPSSQRSCTPAALSTLCCVRCELPCTSPANTSGTRTHLQLLNLHAHGQHVPLTDLAQSQARVVPVRIQPRGARWGQCGHTEVSCLLALHLCRRVPTARLPSAVYILQTAPLAHPPQPGMKGV